MAATVIKMQDNSWGGDKRRLGLGTTHMVPDEVSAEDAEILVKAGKAEWVEGEAPAAPVTQAEIIEAIGKLDQANPDHFTQGGKPQVKAIEELLGNRQISAGDRDAAVAEMAKEG